jgi:hypothetical protein
VTDDGQVVSVREQGGQRVQVGHRHSP